ncbi:hypothetical protein [Gracilibacillus sp. YIM 98692]|uniref:hypothetical protein n=1 Tax=Gracilibacillus sp. YIM 98692 TaxID=2663532 RepID=UPI0013D02858|nr:hypothetical protein [Gracilibacillus sp. YIM 98692]
MAKLRDFLESDFQTFVNTDEFAEEVDIEGNKIEVVMDSDTLEKKKLSNDAEGLANSELLFHVEKNKLAFTPFPRQNLVFNNELYYVTNVQEDEGLYTITLGVHRS